jgi:hypothetical protein
MPAVVGLTGVYDADGSLVGELRYWVGARLGRTHCALCDITHSSVRERREWRECRRGLAVPFETVHRDERTPEVVSASRDLAPVVVARTDDGAAHLLLAPDAVAAASAAADPIAALLDAVEAAVCAAGLAWPDGGLRPR